MSVFSFAGFPMRQALPRGHSFVHFMRAMRPDLPAGVDGAASGGGGRVHGGFDSEARGDITAKSETRMQDGTIRTEAERSYSDGSRRTETWYKRPDGTFEVRAERRSLPDEAGMQRVRVWQPVTAPDGTQRSTFRVFRVPAGMKLDWDSAQAQQYLTVSMRSTKAADGTILSRVTDPLPAVTSANETTDSAETAGKDTTAPQSRPLSATPPPQETFTF